MLKGHNKSRWAFTRHGRSVEHSRVMEGQDEDSRFKVDLNGSWEIILCPKAVRHLKRLSRGIRSYC